MKNRKNFSKKYNTIAVGGDIGGLTESKNTGKLENEKFENDLRGDNKDKNLMK